MPVRKATSNEESTANPNEFVKVYASTGVPCVLRLHSRLKIGEKSFGF
jgi:hypothetical protein